jgi:hypothetical protein
MHLVCFSLAHNSSLEFDLSTVFGRFNALDLNRLSLVHISECVKSRLNALFGSTIAEDHSVLRVPHSVDHVVRQR